VIHTHTWGAHTESTFNIGNLPIRSLVIPSFSLRVQLTHPKVLLLMPGGGPVQVSLAICRSLCMYGAILCVYSRKPEYSFRKNFPTRWSPSISQWILTKIYLSLLFLTIYLKKKKKKSTKIRNQLVFFFSLLTFSIIIPILHCVTLKKARDSRSHDTGRRPSRSIMLLLFFFIYLQSCRDATRIPKSGASRVSRCLFHPFLTVCVGFGRCGLL